mgnify:CR=1 FL=1
MIIIVSNHPWEWLRWGDAISVIIWIDSMKSPRWHTLTASHCSEVVVTMVINHPWPSWGPPNEDNLHRFHAVSRMAVPFNLSSIKNSDLAVDDLLLQIAYAMQIYGKKVSQPVSTFTAASVNVFTAFLFKFDAILQLATFHVLLLVVVGS